MTLVAEVPWRERYDAGAARERAANQAGVRRRFGVPLWRGVLQELPWMAALFLLNLLLQDWVWGAISAGALLVVMLLFRAWARRRYGITTRQEPEPS